MKLKGITVQNRYFKTLTSASLFYNLTIAKVSRRLKAGWSIDQTFDLEPPPIREPSCKKTITVDNITYPSIQAAADHFGLSRHLVGARLKLGWNLKEVFGIIERKTIKTPMKHYRAIECYGTSFTSIGKLAKHYELPYKLVYKRLRLNWSPEQAVGLEVPPPRYRNEDGSAREHSWVKPKVLQDGKKFADSIDGKYYLYIIENTVNDKKYIGITTNALATRFHAHKTSALAGSGKDRSLYNAMRKYGVKKFSIQILRDDAQSIEELLQQEVKAIKKYHAVENGYNTSYGGTIGTATPITVGGKNFSSMGQAANYFKVNAQNFNQRITKLGWTPEQAAELEERLIFGRRNIIYKVNYNGKSIEFPSQSKAAEYFNINVGTVTNRIRNGWTLEQAVELKLPPDGTPRLNRDGYRYNGQHFNSIRDLARHTSVPYQSLLRYLNKCELNLEQSIFILKNKLSKKMQAIMVSLKCNHIESYKILKAKHSKLNKG